jgi:hypothetical protein
LYHYTHNETTQYKYKHTSNTMPPNRKSATALSEHPQGFASLSVEHQGCGRHAAGGGANQPPAAAASDEDDDGGTMMKRVDSSYWKEDPHAPNQQDTYWIDPAAAHKEEHAAEATTTDDDVADSTTPPPPKYHSAPLGMMKRVDSYWKEDTHATGGQQDTYWSTTKPAAADAAGSAQEEAKSADSNSTPHQQPEYHPAPAAIMKRSASYWKEDPHSVGRQETYWTDDPTAAIHEHCSIQQQQQDGTRCPIPTVDSTTVSSTLVVVDPHYHHPAPKSTLPRINSYWKEQPHAPNADDVYWRTEESVAASAVASAASAQQQQQQPVGVPMD